MKQSKKLLTNKILFSGLLILIQLIIVFVAFLTIHRSSRFFVYLFNNGIDGALCHLLHVYFVGRNRHIRQAGRIQEIIKAHNRNILRYPVASLRQRFNYQTGNKVTVAHKGGRHLLGEIIIPVIAS